MKEENAFFALLLVLLSVALQPNKTISAQTAEIRSRKIFILDGTVILEISEGVNFSCIGIRLTDKKLNWQTGTYMEIKKWGKFYLTEEWNGKKYANINAGLEDYLKNIFIDFYNGMGKKGSGRKVWLEFVKDGGLQIFIDFSNKIIDDEFLNSPFNDIYG